MQSGDTLLLATTNPGKVTELRELLKPVSVRVLGARELGWEADVPEDGDTLEANAQTKARAGVAATGVSAVADDSGLFVDALEGAPGVRSARYAGEAQDSRANCAKLLLALEGMPPGERGAEFRCALHLATPAGEDRVFSGVCRGRITLVPRGSRGFGYDPVFEDPETGLTFAEMSFEGKNRISHRGRALKSFCEYMNKRMSEGDA